MGDGKEDGNKEMREEWEIDLNEKGRKIGKGLEEERREGGRKRKGRKGTEEEQKKKEYSIIVYIIMYMYNNICIII